MVGYLEINRRYDLNFYRDIEQHVMMRGKFANSPKTFVGEQVPGSMEAFRKAAEKHFGKPLDMKGFLKLMQDGKLLSKDILPLAAEEMAKMARTGNALKFSMNGLQVAQQRMNLSFKEWMNSIYKSGASDALKDLYKTLDQIFWYSKQGDSALGGFIKGFLGQAQGTIENIYNTVALLGMILEQKFGLDTGGMGEWFGKAAYWITIAAAFNTIYKVISMMIGGGLIGQLTKLAAAMPLFTAAAGATTGGAVAAGGAAAAGAGAMAGGIFATVTIAAITAGAAYSLVKALGADSWGQALGSWAYEGTHITDPNSPNFGKNKLIAAMDEYGNKNFTLPQYQYGGMTYGAQAQPQQQTVKVELTANDKFFDYINMKIKENNVQQVNSMIPAMLARPQ